MDKKVLIADDSQLFREVLERIVNAEKGFTVCASVRDAYAAANEVGRQKPDLVILDIEMPGMNGISFLHSLLPQYAVPVIVCTSHRAAASKALKAGAADFIPKPADNPDDFMQFRQTLVRAMKSALILRSVECNGVVYELKRRTETPRRSAGGEIILIGGSAGSTEALPELLKMLDENRRGADLPPIAASLHMPSGYTKIFAQRLDGTLDLRVKEAENGERLKRSSVYIAPGSKHMRIAADAKGCFLSVAEGAKISGHCPSVDALFESAAQVEFEKVIAVLLTGMGSDGAKGLLKLRERGARTIGQDQKTSLVYGMPKAAFELGAVEKQCALENIAGEICRLLKG